MVDITQFERNYQALFKDGGISRKKTEPICLLLCINDIEEGLIYLVLSVCFSV